MHKSSVPTQQPGRRAIHDRLHALLFALVLMLGVLARTWDFGRVPAGLNVDEASIGVDAYYVLRFGIDRNGVSYPTQFIAYGQEQNALYGYLVMPLLAIFGLKISVLRFPMLVYSLLSLPLLYAIVRRHFNQRLALLCMFFLAISPWHIMVSRWALDQNMLPFVFLLGWGALLEASRDNRWYVAAGLLLAVCFYIYGPTYFIVPCFMLMTTAFLLKRRLLCGKYLVAGLAVFFVVAIPIGLFLLVNTLQLDSIHLGPVTIPRLPATVPRFLSEVQKYGDQPFRPLLVNIQRLARVLVLQTDGLVYNVVEPYGYFYGVTFPLAVLGLFLLFRRARSERHTGAAFLLFWVATCLLFGILQYVSINRLNTIFIPLIIGIAVGVDWLGQKRSWLLPVTTAVLLTAFAGFNIAYHGPDYAARSGAKFRPGLIPAITFASQVSDGPICVTDEPGQAYIFVLFSQQLHPRSYLGNITYLDSPDPERHVTRLGRYTFGKSTCALRPLPVYVLAAKEIPPQLGNRYAVEFFDNYAVYFPKQ